MSVADKFRGLFRSRYLRELVSLDSRRRHLEESLRLCRDAAALGLDIRAQREPFTDLVDPFIDAGLEPIEIYLFAEQNLPADPFWQAEVVRELLRRPKLEREHFEHLKRVAIAQRRNLSLWRRLIEEAPRLGGTELAAETLELVTITLGTDFPEPDVTRWPENSTAEEARRIFLQALDKAVGEILPSGRTDANAATVLELRLAYTPDDAQALCFLARQAMRQGRSDSDALALGLRALFVMPGELDISRWVGRTLVKTTGHEDAGLEMLRQAYERSSDKSEVRVDLVSALKEVGHAVPGDLLALKMYLASNKDDQAAWELAADLYAAREDISEDALEAYKISASTSPKRGKYLKLLARASTSRGNVTVAAEFLDELRAKGQTSEDVILPLATAYADMDRQDPDALEVYRLALQFGTLKPEVHTIYCRHLYLKARTAPESISQFKASRAAVPTCNWARLGFISHLISSGESARALDEASKMLAEAAGDLEAQRYAAMALAQNFNRPQMQKIAALPPSALVNIYEQALAEQPDAAPIREALVRARLALNLRDAETARLLGEVCRRNPEAIDLRVARADILYDLGQKANAAALYRELMERLRVTGNMSNRPGQAIDAGRYDRILERLAECVLEPPGPKPGDLDILIEASSSPTAPAERVVAVARLMIETNYEHALRMVILERAANADPSDDRLEFALAEARLQRGNPRPAIRVALRRLSVGTGDAEVVQLIRSVAAVIRPEQVSSEIVSEVRKLLERGRLRDDARAALAEILILGHEQTPSNIPFYEAVVANHPNEIRFLAALGKCYEAARDDAKAEGVYSRIAALASSMDNDLVMRMAHLNLRLHRSTPESFLISERAIKLAPEDDELVLHHVQMLLDRGRTEHASPLIQTLLSRRREATAARVLAMLENSARISTSHPELLFHVARACIALGRTEQALLTLGRLQPFYQRHFGDLLDCYGELIESAPDNARARIERGILWRLSGRLAEAVEDLEVAHRLSPDNEDIATEYAEVLGQKLDMENSKDATMWSRVGEIHMRAGNTDEAMEACVRAVEAAPNHEASLFLLASVQLETGGLDLARQTLKKMKKEPKLLPLLQRLAFAYEDQGDHSAAAEVLTDALEVSSGERDVLERLRALQVKRAEDARGDSARREVLSGLSSKAQKRYELREELGRGTMGLVFKAYDKELDEVVVLKILPEHFARDPEALSRFRNEAKAARRLAHPNIVRIHDIGQEDGRKHLSMEYVSGGDLKQLLKQRGGRIRPSEAVRLVREVARALAHAHQEGVLHRDIKPANILLTPAGRVKLSDFGVAAMLAEATGLDNSATVSRDGIAGTPLYMSPEQFSDGPLTPASDLYSTGILLYELVVGAPPFLRGSISYHHQYNAPPMPDSIPQPLQPIIARLLAKNPRDRYQTAQDLLNALDIFDEGGRQATRSSGEIRLPSRDALNEGRNIPKVG